MGSIFGKPIIKDIEIPEIEEIIPEKTLVPQIFSYLEKSDEDHHFFIRE